MMNFLTKRVMFVYIQHIDAMLLCFCLVLDHKCGKNEKSGRRGAAECYWCSYRILTFLWSFTERTNGDMESICFYDEKHQWRCQWWRHLCVFDDVMRLSGDAIRWRLLWRHLCVCPPMDHRQEPIKMIVYLTFYSVYELVFRPVAIGELHFFYFFNC